MIVITTVNYLPVTSACSKYVFVMTILAQENKCVSLLAVCGCGAYKYRLSAVSPDTSFVTNMSAPAGKPSPGDSRTSGVSQAMALEDADDKTVSDNPANTNSLTPSERSRSDKREIRTPLPPGAVVPHSGAQRFSHRGYDFHASREGMPAGSHHMQSNVVEVHHHEMNEVNNTMHLQQVQNNEVHMNMHDPAFTLMVEQVAEARH